MTDDVWGLLTRKDTINKITLSVAIPDYEILSEVVYEAKNLISSQLPVFFWDNNFK